MPEMSEGLVTRWLITPRTVWANVRWFCRFRLERWIRRPRCCCCDRAGADVYWSGAWWCRRHPLLVPGSAAGIRPPLRRYTKRQADRLFRVPDARRSEVDGFWKSQPPPRTTEELGAELVDAIEAIRAGWGR